MSNLRLCEAPSEIVEGTIPETFLFPGVTRDEGRPATGARNRIRPSIVSDDTIRSVERNLDQAQDRLNNLRDLVDRFGLSVHDDGPRAA